MVVLKINFEQIQVIIAEKDNNLHKKGIWIVFNENLEYTLITKEPISYKKHCKWWERAFEKEYIYVILYKLEVVGYIRLTKVRTNSKEINEISIALLSQFQKFGVGAYTYKLFEEHMKKIGIKKIVAITDYRNEGGRKFFEKNGYEKSHIRYAKEL